MPFKLTRLLATLLPIIKFPTPSIEPFKVTFPEYKVAFEVVVLPKRTVPLNISDPLAEIFVVEDGNVILLPDTVRFPLVIERFARLTLAFVELNDKLPATTKAEFALIVPIVTFWVERTFTSWLNELDAPPVSVENEIFPGVLKLILPNLLAELALTPEI